MSEATPSPRSRQVGIGIAIIVLGALSVNYSYRYHLLLPSMGIWDILGTVFLLAGLIIRLLAFQEIPITHRIENLATAGIYARTRNPIYLAFILIIIAIAFYARTLLSFAWIAISILLFYWAARQEEKDLLRVFGERYARYKEAVPMFWPRLWK